MLSQLKNLAKAAWPFVKKHAPEVAITVGTILDGVAILFSIKDTTVAQKILEEKKPQTFWEKVGVVVPTYWKTITTFAAGTGLILFGNHLHLERTAVLLGLCATQKEKLIGMAEEAKKLMGPKKAQELEDNVTVKKATEKGLPAPGNLPVIIGGDTMYILEWNNFAFRSCPEQINNIEKGLLRDLMINKVLDVADLDEAFNVGEAFISFEDHAKGWNSKNPFRLRTIWTDGPNGQPIGIIKADPSPEPKWLDPGEE